MVDQYIETTGAVLAGRSGFDSAIGDARPYCGRWQGPIFVLTHHPEDARKADGVTVLSCPVEDAVRIALPAAGGKNVEIFSATIGRQLLEKGLIDEIDLHIAPILLGRGIRLYGNDGDKQIRLRRLDGLDPTVAVKCGTGPWRPVDRPAPVRHGPSSLGTGSLLPDRRELTMDLDAVLGAADDSCARSSPPDSTNTATHHSRSPTNSAAPRPPRDPPTKWSELDRFTGRPTRGLLPLGEESGCHAGPAGAGHDTSRSSGKQAVELAGMRESRSRRPKMIWGSGSRA